MNDEITSRLQDLPPDLADRPDRFESVRGRVVRRRRRRAVVGSALAAALVVVGVSVAAASNDPGQGRSVDAADRSEAPTSVPAPGSQELSVVVVNARDFDRGDLPEGSAVWDAASRTVVYFSPTGYPACLTEGLASADGRAVDLTLAVQPEGCGESLNFAVVKINGLDEAPSDLRVTENGRSRTIPVNRRQGAETQQLSVDVAQLDRNVDGRTVRGTAEWDSADRTVTYVSRSWYDSCLADAVASTVDDTLALTLSPKEPPAGQGCLTIGLWVSATISGLSEAPREVIVTEGDDTRTVPVERAVPGHVGQHATRDFPVNDNGQTYGSAAYATTPETYPDLVAVTATNGESGFVEKRYFQLTPDDDFTYGTVPVVAVDGETPVGSFDFGRREDHSNRVVPLEP